MKMNKLEVITSIWNPGIMNMSLLDFAFMYTQHYNIQVLYLPNIYTL